MWGTCALDGATKAACDYSTSVCSNNYWSAYSLLRPVIGKGLFWLAAGRDLRYGGEGLSEMPTLYALFFLHCSWPWVRKGKLSKKAHPIFPSMLVTLGV